MQNRVPTVKTGTWLDYELMIGGLAQDCDKSPVSQQYFL